MGRPKAIARSIALAITENSRKPYRSRGLVGYIVALFSIFFSFYQLVFEKYCPVEFANLRRSCWHLEDGDYVEAFSGGESQDPGDGLQPIGDMGFSGSTFYETRNGRFLAKSIPRRSEYSFFRDELLTPYSQHMAAHPESMLVRITDFLWARGWSLGKLLRLAPPCHIIMENIMYGHEEAKRRGELEWENWDLKPTSYFYPERDIANGRLTSEATKSQLADEFHDRIVLSKQDADALFSSLEEDTKLLASNNAVDYSLFLVRMQVPGKTPQQVADPGSASTAETSIIPTQPPAVPPSAPSWGTGVPSADGKHLYRAAILDFFWAKHKPQARMMTLLVNTWNFLVSREGPMSITTEADEYRQRFIKMCREYVEIRQGAE